VPPRDEDYTVLRLLARRETWSAAEAEQMRDLLRAEVEATLDLYSVDRARKRAARTLNDRIRDAILAFEDAQSGRATPETFRRRWYGWASSSEGYSVRILGRNDLQYEDEHGVLRIFAEPLAVPSGYYDVATESIPDTPQRPRAVVISRLHRAFRFKGWTLIEEQAGSGT